MKIKSLCRKYELYQMRETKKVIAYVSKVQNLVHLMKGRVETMTEKMIIEKVINIDLLF